MWWQRYRERTAGSLWEWGHLWPRPQVLSEHVLSSCSYFLNAPQKTGESQGKSVHSYYYAHIPNPVHASCWMLAFMSYLEDRCEKIIRGKECYSSLNSRKELIVAKPLEFFLLAKVAFRQHQTFSDSSYLSQKSKPKRQKNT